MKPKRYHYVIYVGSEGNSDCDIVTQFSATSDEVARSELNRVLKETDWDDDTILTLERTGIHEPEEIATISPSQK